MNEVLVGKTGHGGYTYTQPVRKDAKYNLYHGTLEAVPLPPGRRASSTVHQAPACLPTVKGSPISQHQAPSGSRRATSIAYADIG